MLIVTFLLALYIKVYYDPGIEIAIKSLKLSRIVFFFWKNEHLANPIMWKKTLWTFLFQSYSLHVTADQTFKSAAAL